MGNSMSMLLWIFARKQSQQVGSPIKKPYFVDYSLGSTDFTRNLRLSPFETIHGYRGQHTGTDWQIATDPDFNNIVYEIQKSLSAKTELNLADIVENLLSNLIIDSGTTLYVRARYWSGEFYSDWTTPIQIVVPSARTCYIKKLDISDEVALGKKARLNVIVSNFGVNESDITVSVTSDDTQISIIQVNKYTYDIVATGTPRQATIQVTVSAPNNTDTASKTLNLVSTDAVKQIHVQNFKLGDSTKFRIAGSFVHKDILYSIVASESTLFLIAYDINKQEIVRAWNLIDPKIAIQLNVSSNNEPISVNKVVNNEDDRFFAICIRKPGVARSAILIFEMMDKYTPVLKYVLFYESGSVDLQFVSGYLILDGHIKFDLDRGVIHGYRLSDAGLPSTGIIYNTVLRRFLTFGNQTYAVGRAKYRTNTGDVNYGFSFIPFDLENFAFLTDSSGTITVKVLPVGQTISFQAQYGGVYILPDQTIITNLLQRVVSNDTTQDVYNIVVIQPDSTGQPVITKMYKDMWILTTLDLGACIYNKAHYIASDGSKLTFLKWDSNDLIPLASFDQNICGALHNYSVVGTSSIPIFARAATIPCCRYTHTLYIRLDVPIQDQTHTLDVYDPDIKRHIACTYSLSAPTPLTPATNIPVLTDLTGVLITEIVNSPNTSITVVDGSDVQITELDPEFVNKMCEFRIYDLI